MNMQFGDCGMPERLWDAGEGVCCAAFQLGACVHTEGYFDEDYENPDQDLFDVHCCQSHAVAGGDWHDAGCPVHGWLIDAAWSLSDDLRWAAFAPELKPF